MKGFTMQHKQIRFGQGVWGRFAGGGRGGQPMPLMILTMIVLSMALLTVLDTVWGGPEISQKPIPFKCVSCGHIVIHKVADLQKLHKPGSMTPMMGPMVLDCPKCGKKSLTQAIECPKCTEIFVMTIDPDKRIFNDKCPKCGVSYAQAWKEKYQKSKGQ
jgi:predicted RNA-binding Zn-ribbon protein involved in translation (DUF1610 family)